jgi:hypothetical protein
MWRFTHCTLVLSHAAACPSAVGCSKRQFTAATAAAAERFCACRLRLALLLLHLYCVLLGDYYPSGLSVYSTTTVNTYTHAHRLLCWLLLSGGTCSLLSSVKNSWRKQASLSLPLQGSKVCYCWCAAAAAAVRTAHTQHTHCVAAAASSAASLHCCAATRCSAAQT